MFVKCLFESKLWSLRMRQRRVYYWSEFIPGKFFIFNKVPLYSDKLIGSRHNYLKRGTLLKIRTSVPATESGGLLPTFS